MLSKEFHNEVKDIFSSEDEIERKIKADLYALDYDFCCNYWNCCGNIVEKIYNRHFVPIKYEFNNNGLNSKFIVKVAPYIGNGDIIEDEEIEIPYFLMSESFFDAIFKIYYNFDNDLYKKELNRQIKIYDMMIKAIENGSAKN